MPQLTDVEQFYTRFISEQRPTEYTSASVVTAICVSFANSKSMKLVYCVKCAVAESEVSVHLSPQTGVSKSKDVSMPEEVE